MSDFTRSIFSCDAACSARWKAIRLRRRRALAAVAALLTLVGSSSVCHGQQAASVTGTEETLAEKVNDPTANLTQITVQDLYAPAEYGTNAQPNTLQIRHS